MSDWVFEIGLVMAGAVSAGAYSAGVIDFLIEALDAWEATRGQADVPRHRVRINVLSGASAGGMTAAMLASLVGRDFDPVRFANAPGGLDNPFHEAWVRRIDLRHLLQLRDIQRGQAVASLLDSTVLDDIAAAVFQPGRPRPRRPYFAEPLELFLSVANLRGVPYAIELSGSKDGHGIMMHMDHLQFRVDGDGADVSSGAVTPQTWDAVIQAALASGAFPLGLRPRMLTRPAGDYARRLWDIPTARDADPVGPCTIPQVIPPHWDLTDEDPYRFCCVDGGLMDNEPLELARRVLARGGRNPRAGREACRAVVMIDPFPEPPLFDPAYSSDDDPSRLDLLAIAQSMFAGLRNQARFKMDELRLAQEESIYSRFLISPSRHLPDGSETTPSLASGSMGAFGGFLDIAFREHDYHLGRRNCQQFLRRHFVLMEDNPIVRDWKGDREAYWVRRLNADSAADPYGRDDGQRLLPIIPLMPHLRPAIPAQPWPAFDRRRFGELRGLINRRLQIVAERLIARHLSGFGRLLAIGVLGLRKGAVADEIIKWMDRQLVAHKLLRP